MLLQHKTLVGCKNHISKRVADVLGLQDCSVLLPHLTLTKKQDFKVISFEIPLKHFQINFNVNKINSVLSLTPDSLIKRTYENSEVNCITFDISKDEFVKSVLKDTNYILPNLNQRKNILVEYSSPNIAKPFHVGHLRSTIIGNFVANILEKSHNIKRLNYLGDWGKQIGFVKAGLEASKITDVNILDNPMKEMYNAYTLANNDATMSDRAREIFCHLEKGESPEWKLKWETIRMLTIKHLEKTYKAFGISFDEYSFESNYRAENISHVVEMLNKNELSSFKNGCMVLNMDGKDAPLFKSDGTTLYLVRDIAAAIDRINKYECDSMIYVVDKSQSEHIKNLKYAISNLSKKNIIHHIPFGRITGMSTRKGTSVFLDDILHETMNRMAEQQLKSPNTRTSDPEVTKILGVTALIIYILKQRRNRDFNFSWEIAMQGTGDSGVKLQYTHSRLNSLEKHNDFKELPEEADPTALKEDIAFELIYELARYQEVLYDSQEHLESSFLVIYLFKLCNLVSRALKKLPVKGEPHDIAAQRLLLFNTAKNTIGSAMKTLGLQPLKEM